MRYGQLIIDNMIFIHMKFQDLQQEKVGCLINESAFVALNYVTWPIRNSVQNPRSVRSSRKISNLSLFQRSSNPISLFFCLFGFFFVFFKMNMLRKILKYEYKPKGTGLCNPGKCWDGRRMLDVLVDVILKKSLLLELLRYQFFFTNCWITIHYFLPVP